MPVRLSLSLHLTSHFSLSFSLSSPLSLSLCLFLLAFLRESLWLIFLVCLSPHPPSLFLSLTHWFTFYYTVWSCHSLPSVFPPFFPIPSSLSLSPFLSISLYLLVFMFKSPLMHQSLSVWLSFQLLHLSNSLPLRLPVLSLPSVLLLCYWFQPEELLESNFSHVKLLTTAWKLKMLFLFNISSIWLKFESV